MFDWTVLRLRRSVVKFEVSSPVDHLFASPSATMIWLVTLPLAAILTVVAWPLHLALVSSAWVVVSYVLLALRFPFGRDGADQVALFLALAVLAYQLHPTESAATVILVLICIQLTAGYMIAGWSKLTAPAWIRGDAMHSILRSSCYGCPPLAKRIDRRMAHVAGLSVAVFEGLFAVIWFAPAPVGVAFLAFGLVFHAGAWAIMGLNSFFLTFSAGYPALFWLVLSG